jgi:hypothetical protein
MTRYSKTVTIEVEVEAFTENDAECILDDIFGAGELTGFDVTVRNMTIVN